MGKRKWKAKKLEKKERKAQLLEKQNGVKNNTVQQRGTRDNDVEMNIHDEGDSEDEMAAAKKVAAEKNRKKSGGFQSMGLSHAVLKGVLRRGYKVPTPIQRKTIPIILEGKDVVAMARTGSGKTAAFLVPMFEKLKTHSSTGARAIIMSPTRELALQTLKFTKEIGKFTGLKAAVVLGGDRMDDQFAALHQSPDVIIATPGRFLHVLVEMEMKLKAVEYIVFDEADRLFEMGFQDQLQEIIHRLPDSRQTLLFSATLPKSLVEFVRAGLTDPTLIRLDVDSKLSENLKLTFLSCRDPDKCALLLYFLKHVIKRKEQTVVFAATKHHVEFLYLLLTLSGLSVTYIYSSLDQAARKINAAKFSMGKVKILIVTDLAARGIDVPLLDNVINFNFPAKPKLFVHRVGRVARAGRSGTAYSLVSPDEMAHFVDLHMFLGRPLKLVTLGQSLEADEDGYMGEVPQSLIDDEETEVAQTIKESVELTGLVRVCSNAYKKYCKSRPAPAPDSIRRVKKMAEEGMQFGLHPMFNSMDVDEKGKRLEMLNALKSYKPKTTIFEINSTSKKTGLEVMKAKRAQHEQILVNNEARRREREAEMLGEGGSALPSESLSSNSRKRKAEEADQKDIAAVFDQVVSGKKSKTSNISPTTKASKRSKLAKKSAGDTTEVKDKENYIQYRPSDYASERGLSISALEKAAEGAVDFTNEGENSGSNKKMRKWDRKKKRFVNIDPNADSKKKMIKTESGNWISASYKSSAYREWKHKTKFNERDADDDDDDDSPRKGGKKRKGNLGGGGDGGGRFTVMGMRKKNWHTKGTEGDTKNKGKFKLKTPDEILKDRRKKSKIQHFQKHRQNERAKRQGKPTGGKGGGKGFGGKGKGKR